MKSTFLYIICLGIACSIFSACSDDEGTPTVYMPEATKVISNTFKISDAPYEITYSAAVVGSDYPTTSGLEAPENIQVTFKVDPSLVAAFNAASGTDYLTFPEGSYSIESSGTIQKGTAKTPALKLTITAKGKIDPFKAYLLPVSIDKVTGAAVSSMQRTTYFALTGTSDLDDLTPFDRTQWTIAGFSSEEANGEGAGNGHALHAIDSDDGTFWHTQWQGGEPKPPHWITIDMHETKLVHGIMIDPRNHWQGQPAEIKVEISEDNINWQDGGTITENDLMSNQYGSSGSLQHQPYKRFLSFMRTGRYIKITVLETMPDWNNLSASRPYSSHIAEIFAM